jgi:hypothetical protein
MLKSASMITTGSAPIVAIGGRRDLGKRKSGG